MFRRASARVVAVTGLLRAPCCVFGWGGISLFLFLRFFFFEHTRPAASTRPRFASFTSLVVMTQGRRSEATESVGAFRAKKPLHTGVRTGCHCLICLSVCVCVCDIEFVVFTDCDSCTRQISTNPGPMEAGEYGLSRGTCFAARRLELVAVTGLIGAP